MKKEELKSDMRVFDKLKDYMFCYELNIAYDVFVSLKISNKADFYLYQMQLDALKKVTYEEIKSYGRLLDLEYYNIILELKKQIAESKIVTFPKFN